MIEFIVKLALSSEDFERKFQILLEKYRSALTEVFSPATVKQVYQSFRGLTSELEKLGTSLEKLNELKWNFWSFVQSTGTLLGHYDELIKALASKKSEEAIGRLPSVLRQIYRETEKASKLFAGFGPESERWVQAIKLLQREITSLLRQAQKLGTGSELEMASFIANAQRFTRYYLGTIKEGLRFMRESVRQQIKEQRELQKEQEKAIKEEAERYKWLYRLRQELVERTLRKQLEAEKTIWVKLREQYRGTVLTERIAALQRDLSKIISIFHELDTRGALPDTFKRMYLSIFEAVSRLASGVRTIDDLIAAVKRLRGAYIGFYETVSKQGVPIAEPFKQAITYLSELEMQLTAIAKSKGKVTAEEWYWTLNRLNSGIKALAPQFRNFIDNLLKAEQLTNEQRVALQMLSAQFQEMSRGLFSFAGRIENIAIASFTLYYNMMFVTEALANLRRGIIEAGVEYERYLITLTALTKSQEIAGKQLRWLYEFASRTPFTVRQVIEAWKTLSAYGVANERTLRATLNLTLAFNRDVKDVANAIGRALKGSTEGFEVLRRTLGANTEVLKRFGAVVDKNNRLILNNYHAIQKNGEAVLRYAESLGDLVKASEGAYFQVVSNLQDIVDLIKKDLAEATLEVFGGMLKQVEKLGRALEKLPTTLKAMTGMGIVITSGLAQAIGSAIGFGAQLSMIIISLVQMEQLLLDLRRAGVTLLELGATGRMLAAVFNAVSWSINSVNKALTGLSAGLTITELGIYAGVILAVATAIGLIGYNLEKTNEKLKEVTANLEQYNQLLKEAENMGSVSSEAIAKLREQYGDMADYLNILIQATVDYAKAGDRMADTTDKLAYMMDQLAISIRSITRTELPVLNAMIKNIIASMDTKQLKGLQKDLQGVFTQVESSVGEHLDKVKQALLDTVSSLEKLNRETFVYHGSLSNILTLIKEGIREDDITKLQIAVWNLPQLYSRLVKIRGELARQGVPYSKELDLIIKLLGEMREITGRYIREREAVNLLNKEREELIDTIKREIKLREQYDKIAKRELKYFETKLQMIEFRDEIVASIDRESSALDRYNQRLAVIWENLDRMSTKLYIQRGELEGLGKVYRSIAKDLKEHGGVISLKGLLPDEKILQLKTKVLRELTDAIKSDAKNMYSRLEELWKNYEKKVEQGEMTLREARARFLAESEAIIQEFTSKAAQSMYETITGLSRYLGIPKEELFLELGIKIKAESPDEIRRQIQEWIKGNLPSVEKIITKPEIKKKAKDLFAPYKDELRELEKKFRDFAKAFERDAKSLIRDIIEIALERGDFELLERAWQTTVGRMRDYFEEQLTTAVDRLANRIRGEMSSLLEEYYRKKYGEEVLKAKELYEKVLRARRLEAQTMLMYRLAMKRGNEREAVYWYTQLRRIQEARRYYEKQWREFSPPERERAMEFTKVLYSPEEMAKIDEMRRKTEEIKEITPEEWREIKRKGEELAMLEVPPLFTNVDVLANQLNAAIQNWMQALEMQRQAEEMLQKGLDVAVKDFNQAVQIFKATIEKLRGKIEREGLPAKKEAEK